MACRTSGFLLGLALAFLACDLPQVETCGQIPDDGCPIGRGGTCDDVYCGALYDCLEGEWTLVESCPDNSLGGGGAGAGAAGEGGACSAEIFDYSQEVEGCTPELQEPDCPAQAGETCGGACTTGCVDFYLCVEAGWELVGFCDDEGELQVVQGLEQ